MIMRTDHTKFVAADEYTRMYQLIGFQLRAMPESVGSGRVTIPREDFEKLCIAYDLMTQLNKARHEHAVGRGGVHYTGPISTTERIRKIESEIVGFMQAQDDLYGSTK